MSGKKLLYLSIFILLFNNSIVFSQTRDKEPNILVYIYSSDADIGSALKDDISKSISNKLKIAEFNVIRIENDTAITELLETAEWMGAFFVIEVLFSVKADSILFDISCYSVWDSEILISVSSETETSLLDEDIKEKLDEVIPIIQKNLYVIEQQILAEEIVREKELEQEQALEEDQESEQVAKVEQEAVSEPEFIKEKEQGPKPFIIQAGVAPVIATGGAAKYFTVGVEFSLFGGYSFANPLGCLTLGLSTTINYFKSEGVLITSDIFLFSVGPELRFDMGVNSFAAILFRLSSGGALLMVNVNNSGYRNMLIPFISVGLGAGFSISDFFGFSVISNYSVYMERSTPISGFIPTLEIYYRF